MSAVALRPAVVARPHDEAAPIALELFNRLDRLPSTYFVHLAHDNRNAPLIRDGEVVVIDQGGAAQGGWYPTEGGLFLIEHRSEPTGGYDRYPRFQREVVQTYCDDQGKWWTAPLARGGRTLYLSDGPYRDELALADKLIGKVIGLYVPQAGEALQ